VNTQKTRAEENWTKLLLDCRHVQKELSQSKSSSGVYVVTSIRSIVATFTSLHYKCGSQTVHCRSQRDIEFGEIVDSEGVCWINKPHACFKSLYHLSGHVDAQNTGHQHAENLMLIDGLSFSSAVVCA
jgi:hypothetical protein